MGEYFDIGVQTPILGYIILFSSIGFGAIALLDVNTENDDDDSDSGSGGLMQPIWFHLNGSFLVFIFDILYILKIPPNAKNKAIKDEITINNTNNNS